jgi:hypothetical protein
MGDVGIDAKHLLSGSSGAIPRSVIENYKPSG